MRCAATTRSMGCQPAPRPVFSLFFCDFNRKMQKLPLFSCILIRNEGKNGQPGLLTEVLREQWGFEGFVVSDYDGKTTANHPFWSSPDRRLRVPIAWVFMSIRDGDHPYAKTATDAAVFGINAGLDQEGGGNGCVSLLPQLVKNGTTVSKAAVETAFRCELESI